jgi:hypothetical protein
MTPRAAGPHNMGYLVAAHVTRTAPDVARLKLLPPGLAWALYRDEDVPAWYLDTFKADRKKKWTFASPTLTSDFPIGLPDDLAALTRVYAALQSARLANGFKRGFLSANLFISKILQRPVCSFYADDDSLDFACVSDNGVLQRLRCECGDLEIVYQNGSVTIQPLQPEIEDDEGNLTDFRQLHDPEAGVAVLERNKEQSSLLHFVAGSELATFLEISIAPLGLGSFDGLKKMPLKIASSDGPTAAPR